MNSRIAFVFAQLQQHFGVIEALAQFTDFANLALHERQPTGYGLCIGLVIPQVRSASLRL